MNKIIFKIVEYDDVSNSLIISFASDETKSQDPSNYPVYAYQPLNMWPDVTDIEQIKKNIAQAGLYLANQQKIREEFVADPVKIQQYKALVGQTIQYNISDITTPAILDNHDADLNELVI